MSLISKHTIHCRLNRLVDERKRIKAELSVVRWHLVSYTCLLWFMLLIIMSHDAYAPVCVAYRAVVACALVATNTWICSSFDVDCPCDKPLNTKKAKSPNLWRPFIRKPFSNFEYFEYSKYVVYCALELRCILCSRSTVYIVLTPACAFSYLIAR